MQTWTLPSVQLSNHNWAALNSIADGLAEFLPESPAVTEFMETGITGGNTVWTEFPIKEEGIFTHVIVGPVEGVTDTPTFHAISTSADHFLTFKPEPFSEVDSGLQDDSVHLDSTTHPTDFVFRSIDQGRSWRLSTAQPVPIGTANLRSLQSGKVLALEVFVSSSIDIPSTSTELVLPAILSYIASTTQPRNSNDDISLPHYQYQPATPGRLSSPPELVPDLSSPPSDGVVSP